jgi:hypothetical protein
MIHDVQCRPRAAPPLAPAPRQLGAGWRAARLIKRLRVRHSFPLPFFARRTSSPGCRGHPRDPAAPAAAGAMDVAAATRETV